MNRLPDRARHLDGEAGREFPGVNLLADVGCIPDEALRLPGLEHSIQRRPVESLVCVSEENRLLREPGRAPLRRRRCLGIAKAEKSNGESVLGEIQQFPVVFILLHDVSDVARSNPQRFRGDHGGLSGDQGIATGQKQISFSRQAKLFSLRLTIRPHTRCDEDVEPALIICEKEQNQWRFGDERLIVAGYRELVLDRLILNLDDGIEHHVPGGGGTHSGVNNQIYSISINWPILIYPY